MATANYLDLAGLTTYNAKILEKISELEGGVSAVGDVVTLKGVVATVSALPTTNNSNGDFYFVTADGSEHIWFDTKWYDLGTAVDTSNFVQTSDISAIPTASIEALFS